MSAAHEQTLREVERRLQASLQSAARRFGARADAPQVSLNCNRDGARGDYSTPAALAAGKAWRVDPLGVARAVVEDTGPLPGVAALEAVEPGFINLRMASSFWSELLRDVLARGDEYGASDGLAALGPVLIEFSSANPTGPLLVVQGRSAALGAALVNIFRFAGARSSSETYVNDTGGQLDVLADSLYARYATLCGTDTRLPADGYQGDYLIEIARELRQRDGDKWLDAEPAERRRILGDFALERIVAQQRADMAAFGVHFDRWFSERSLHESGEVDRALRFLIEAGHAYEREGALWLRSSAFGDDADRVLRRSDGRPTYIAADTAYHFDKLRRGNRRLIDVLGPDHHGYVARLHAIVAALGHPGSLEVLIAQQVTLKRGAETVSMSKRAGNVVTLREIIDEVGSDAARFFFVSRKPASHLVFDLALAVEHSAKNPVYYVQYGHARIASIIGKAEETGRSAALRRAREAADLALLQAPVEIDVCRRIADFARTVADAARAREPHRVAEYARDLATDFHAFYTRCIVLGEDDALAGARLSLCLAAKTVLASALRLLGVSAPERM